MTLLLGHQILVKSLNIVVPDSSRTTLKLLILAILWEQGLDFTFAILVL